MKTKKTLIIAGTLVAGLGALVPMSTYAVSATPKTANVSVTVNPTITIDATTDFSKEMDATNVITGTIGATITSNAPYSISLNTDAGKTALSSSTTSDTIPAGKDIASGTNAWGIKKKGGATNNDNASDASDYTAITASPVVFYNAAAGATGAVTNFTVGISIAPSLAAGTYSTQVTVTAATR